MPIGRFAKASRLSVKSLRNYDDAGLLPAAIAEFLAAEDPGAVLASHLAELEARRDQLDRTIGRVIHLLKTEGLTMDTGIAVKDTPAQRVAAFRRPATQEEN